MTRPLRRHEFEEIERLAETLRLERIYFPEDVDDGPTLTPEQEAAADRAAEAAKQIPSLFPWRR